MRCALQTVLFVFALLCRSMAESEVALPPFEEEEFIPMNIGGGPDSETSGLWAANSDIIVKVIKSDSPVMLESIRERLKLKTTLPALKLIYAGILAYKSDKEGQRYLIESGRNAETLQEALDAFWVVGRLNRSISIDNIELNAEDIKWAEPFMLEMLTKSKKLKSPESYPEPMDRIVVAMSSDGGDFGRILAKNKCAKIYPILESLWKSNLSYLDRREIFIAFDELKDRRAIPIFMESLAAHEGDEYRYAASALQKMDVKEAIPILLKHLDDCYTYGPLSGFQDPRILPALKEALPKLKEYELGDAKILIIKLEDTDKLPRFIELAKDPQHKDMSFDLMDEIYELKDPRSINFAVDELNNSTDLHRIFQSIEILSLFKNDAVAIKALIDGLKIDFDALAEGKNVARDNNEFYRSKIADHLMEMTEQRELGTDRDKWLDYFHKTHSQHK
jgi:PBS lyase HEAT-like repeat